MWWPMEISSDWSNAFYGPRTWTISDGQRGIRTDDRWYAARRSLLPITGEYRPELPGPDAGTPWHALRALCRRLLRHVSQPHPGRRGVDFDPLSSRKRAKAEIKPGENAYRHLLPRLRILRLRNILLFEKHAR